MSHKFKNKTMFFSEKEHVNFMHSSTCGALMPALAKVANFVTELNFELSFGIFYVRYVLSCLTLQCSFFFTTKVEI